MKFHLDGSLPGNNGKRILVYGCNHAGKLEGGAGEVAMTWYGARPGASCALVGKSYGIPVQDIELKPLPLYRIEEEVTKFVLFARTRSDLEFFVTRIGCGWAGFDNERIAPLFRGAPDNCSFAEEWATYLNGDAAVPRAKTVQVQP